MITYPHPPKPLPPIDYLIAQEFQRQPVLNAATLAGMLGEHASNVTEWLRRFRKLGLVGVVETQCSGQVSYRADSAAIKRYLNNHRFFQMTKSS